MATGNSGHLKVMGNLTWIEIVYWASAIIGGLLFILRALALFFVGGNGGDFHGDYDAGYDASHGDSDASFNLLSLQGLSAFFMMFGLVGLALVSSNLATVWTIIGGVVAGIFTVWVISLIFSIMKNLQSEGTLRLENAVGKEGTVYLSIPANGIGKVRISIQGSLKVIDAISAKDVEIKTGEIVKVVAISGDQTLIVERK